MRARKPLTLLCLFLFTGFTRGQDYLIGDAAISTCTGVLFDSGGPSDSYLPNEDLTSTICGAAPGNVVSLVFTQFNLSNSGGAQVDWLRIYDGPTVQAPLLGEFTQQQLQGLVVTATAQNTSGCLTLHFTSNNIGSGDFAATISCNVPCPPPVPSFTTMNDTLIVCLGTSIAVDASASFATGPQGLSAWNWLSSAPGMSVAQNAALDTLTFSQSGLHNVRLQVEDGNGCASAYSAAFTVVVRPGASFAGTHASPSTTCLNDPIALTGAATLDSLYLFVDAATEFPNGAELPDNVGSPFISTIEVDWYPVGAVLTDPAELGGICVSMEHSFMGDLVISLACPNGTSIALHQQGGGGTFIGGANDVPNGSDFVFGTCWDYCWTPNAPNGTFAQCAAFGATPNVMLGGTPPANALIPGDYTSVESLTNLVGCPINGTWTLTILDLWAADDGSICSWSLGLQPLADSTLVSFSAQLNLGDPGLTAWSGPGAQAGALPTLATADPGMPGNHAYTFTVIDSQGCLHDTTVVVTVLETPVLVDAGADLTLCSGSETMSGTAQLITAQHCTYKLVLLEVLGDTWNGGAQVQVDIDGSITTHAILTTGITSDTIPLAVIHGQSIALYYTAGTIWNNENSFKLFDAQGLLLYQSPQGPPTGLAYQSLGDCSNIDPGLLVSWSPTTGLSDPGSLTTTIAPPASGYYVLTVMAPWNPCPVSDSVLVSNGGIATTMELSPGGDALCIEPATFVAYHWYLGGAFFTTTTTNCLANPAFGIWTAIAESAAGCDGFPDPVENCPLLVFSYDNVTLSVQAGLGTYAWTYNGAPVGDSGASLNVAGLGTYTVTCTMAGGCVITSSYEVGTMSSIGESAEGRGASIVVVPNPNKGAFELILPSAMRGTIEITLLDLSGRITSTTSIAATGAQRMPLQVHVAPGAYQLRVRNGSALHWGRVIIE